MSKLQWVFRFTMEPLTRPASSDPFDTLRGRLRHSPRLSERRRVSRWLPIFLVDLIDLLLDPVTQYAEKIPRKWMIRGAPEHRRLGSAVSPSNCCTGNYQVGVFAVTNFFAKSSAVPCFSLSLWSSVSCSGSESTTFLSLTAIHLSGYSLRTVL